jgi:hypothetical protein
VFFLIGLFRELLGELLGGFLVVVRRFVFFVVLLLDEIKDLDVVF